jgi:hypothetical protein
MICKVCGHNLTVNGFCRSCNNPSKKHPGFLNKKHSEESNIKRSNTIREMYKNGILMGFRSKNAYKTPIGNKPTTGCFKKGITPWNKYINSDEYKNHYKNGFGGTKNKGKFTGENSPHWKGGPKSENAKARNSDEYKMWRKLVFERDNYTCVWCGQVGKELHADHIHPFAYFPELRFDINNGRTLCKKCHKKTDTYLSGSIKYKKSRKGRE